MVSDPANCLARAYDMVLNGWEIGGGSIRIHRADVQEEAEFLLLLFRADFQRGKHFLLYVCAVDTDRAAADFPAVNTMS